MPLSPITPFYNQSVLHHLLYVVFRTFSPKEFCRNFASFLDEYMPVSMLEIKKYDNFIISKIASYSANSEIFDSPDRIEIPEQIIQDICQDPYLTQCKSSAKIIRSTPDTLSGACFPLFSGKISRVFTTLSFLLTICQLLSIFPLSLQERIDIRKSICSFWTASACRWSPPWE